MRRVGGVILILSGLAVAAYSITSGSDSSEPEIAGRAAAKPDAAFATPVVVTIAQRPSEPFAPRATASPKGREALARELQKELKRVGCYEGELNGTWTPMTRRAMKAFADWVNATLPVDEPDAILYAMVQGHQDKACGKPCPSGQGRAEEGRCVPNAILSKAAKKGPPPAAVASTRKTDLAAAEKQATAVTGWSTVTTFAAPVPAPVIVSAPALGAPPAEGRMALAGPTSPLLPLAEAPVAKKAAPAARRVVHRPSRVPVQQVSGRSSWARSMLARRDWFN